MATRRVVAANKGGRSAIISDQNDLSNAFTHVPGFDPVVAWQTNANPGVAPERASSKSVVPAVGGTTLFIVTFPPDSVMASPGFDPVAAGGEYMQRLPGLAELFEMESPGMHTSPTVDYDIVIEGELWCEVDDGVAVHLKQGDVMIQHGSRHAWRNRGDKPAKIAFVLIGAK